MAKTPELQRPEATIESLHHSFPIRLTNWMIVEFNVYKVHDVSQCRFFYLKYLNTTILL